MQTQMSGASAPEPMSGRMAAVPESPGPAVVRPLPGKPGRARFWLAAAFLAAAAIAAVLYLRYHSAEQARQRAAAAMTAPTAPITVGDLQQTIRLSGVVQAERFVQLLAPRMRGSRSDLGRDAPSGGTQVAMPGGGGSSTDTSSIAPAGGFSSQVVGSSSSLGASRATTTNRFGGSSSSSAASSSSSSGGSGGTSSSSSSSTTPSGGGGGGHTDFSLILVDLVKPGARVKKGQTVAEFDRQYMLLRLDDYRASGDQMDANLKQTKADMLAAREAEAQIVKSAKGDLDKALLDYKTIDVRSAIEAERFKMAVEEARARYKQVQQEARLFDESQRAQFRASQIDREQARLEFQRAETNAERMLLKAPIDGIAVMQSIFRGGDFAQVQMGDEVHSGQFFMSIVDPSSMVVDATVNQVDSEKLRLGMKARVKLDAYRDVNLPATIIGIGALSKASDFRGSYVARIPVRFRIEAQDPRVIPDLSASADVALASEPNATLAPRAAVFTDGGNGRPFVFLASPTGWIRREVELGMENNVTVAVRSGLRKGDMVAVRRPRM